MGGVIARDPAAAARETWDLVVVGGGVYGVGVCLEAARRGLRPLLLERGDFGGETSWNSLRIVHGGLRYLQKADLHRFRESVGERAWFLRHFPDLVEPLACLMPLYGDGMRRPPILAAALGANHLLSLSRNRGVREDRRLPAGAVLSRQTVRERFPLARQDGLRGGALWYDATMPDSQRLLIELLRSACAAGASALNRMEVLRLRTDGGRVSGVEARDAETGNGWSFSAPLVVNCAGPVCRAFAREADRDLPELFRPSLAFNVVFDRPPPAEPAVAVAAPGRDARTFFLTGWKGRLFVGTFHDGIDSDEVAEPQPAEAQLARFVAELNAAVPGLDVTRDAVLRVHAGLLPARSRGSDELAVREVIHDHGSAGGPRGLVSVSGVKWTTARLVGAKTCSQFAPRRAAAPFRRADGTPPPRWTRFRELATADRAAARAIVRGIVQRESARTAEDVVYRRTDWGSLPADAERALALVRELAGEGTFVVPRG